jgi:hypothetical protein
MDSKKKIRITKKRNKALHAALSLDDYLFEKFRRLDEYMKQKYQRYIRNPRQCWEVVRRLPEGNYVKEKVVACEVSDCGTRVIIQ